MKVYFDMDGTIANLYEVENWEVLLHKHSVTPYDDALPCGNLNKLMELLRAYDVKVGVISWCAMNGNYTYDWRVRQRKKAWIKKNFPIASEIHIVKYGTPKHLTIKKELRESAILVDDNKNVCDAWKGKAVNFNSYEELMEKLEKVLQKAA